MGIEWVSNGYRMGIDWVLDEYHIEWVLNGYSLGIKRVSNQFQMSIEQMNVCIFTE